MSDETSEREIGQGLRQATALLRSGAVEEALELLARLDREHPGREEIMRTRGIVLARQGRTSEAEPLLRELAERAPDSPDAAGDHAQVLLALNRGEEAVERLVAVRQARPDTPLAELGPVFAFNLGMACKAAGRPAEAVEPLREVLRHKPDQYAALIALGDVCKALGKIDEAGVHYREAIQVQPDIGTAWWSLSNLKSGGFTDEEANELAQRAAAPGRESNQQVYFEFALATALDARGRTAEAFRHYTAGNRLKQQQSPWDRDRFSRWLDELRNAMADVPLPQRPDTFGAPRPVFIVSLPRSGSTLTEQILAAHSGVTAAGELPWLPQIVAEESRRREAGVTEWAGGLDADGWQRLGQAYLDRCRRWHEDTPVFTDKLPGNLPYIGVMLAMQPDALVVGVRRDPMDVCWSCYRQLFISGSEFAYDLEDLAAYWKDADRHLEHWRQRAPDRVHVVDYESLAAGPERETRALLDFLGLPFEEACLRPQDADRAVTTASAAQVRQAIHSGGVGHWERYRDHLGVLREAFGRYVRR